MEGPYLNTAQTGDLMGLTERAMQERRRRGDGPPYIRISATCVRYDRRVVEKWLQERTFTSTAEEAAGVDG